MQVTEGDGYYLGRVLISAQIAAGYALTPRLRCGYIFLRLHLRLSKKQTLRGIDEGTL